MLTIELHEHESGQLAIVCKEYNYHYGYCGNPFGLFRRHAELFAEYLLAGGVRRPPSAIAAIIDNDDWTLIADWHSNLGAITIHRRAGIGAIARQFLGGEMEG